MRNSKILILGASGFIGFHIFKSLNAEFEVYGSYLSNKNFIKHYLDYFLKIDIIDFTSARDIIKKVNPNLIINCVAISNAKIAEENKELAYKVNVVGIENIVKICEEIDARLIHFSTDNVFDGKKPVKELYTESDLPNPINYYGKTKLVSEKISQELTGSIILRTALVYGKCFPNQHENFFQHLIKNCKNGVVISAYTDQYRTPIRVEDICEVIKKIIKMEYRFPGDIYNIAGPDSVNRYEIALSICETFNLDTSLVKSIQCPDPKMPRNLSLDALKIIKLLNFKFTDLKTGLKLMREKLK